jgi:hypothetical protein
VSTRALARSNRGVHEFLPIAGIVGLFPEIRDRMASITFGRSVASVV